MQKTQIVLISLVLLFSASMAQADVMTPVSATAVTTETKTTVPANMSDEALASYISGRLRPLLADDGYKVTQNCDASGCSVVVQ